MNFQEQRKVQNLEEAFINNQQYIQQQLKLCQAETGQYSKLMGDIQTLIGQSIKKITEKNEKIKWVPQFSASLKCETIQFGMQHLITNIHYGNYIMRVATLVTCFNDEEMDDQIFDQGAFGSIYKIKIKDDAYAVKGINISIDQGKINLDHVYQEYFLCFITSLLEIGPNVECIMGFDILTFKNKACFAMQMCRTLQRDAEINQVYSQMIQNMKYMHSIGLIHMDIKPNNIVYSLKRQKYVFIDFGFSRLIQESLGQKTLSTFCGTLRYCSTEMRKNYFTNNTTFIDLYYNDLISLKRSVEQMQEQAKDEERSQVFHYLQQERRQHGMKSSLSHGFMEAVIKVCFLKYLILWQDKSKIIQVVQQSLHLCKSFLAILGDQYLKSEIRQSEQIVCLVRQLRKYLSKHSFYTPIHDQQISKLILEKDRPILTPQILSLHYILAIENTKFQKMLGDLNFTHRLFSAFDPLSSVFPLEKSGKLSDEINCFRAKIVNKVFDCLPDKGEKDAILYQKTRAVLVFFYSELRKLRNRQVIISLRTIFIMAEDYSLLPDLQHNICLLVTDECQRVLVALEFTLFDKVRNHLKKDRGPIFRGFAGQLKEFNKSTSQILTIAAKLLSIDKYFSFSQEIKTEFTLGLNKIIESKPQYKKEVNNIKALLSFLFRVNLIDHKEHATFLQQLYLKSKQRYSLSAQKLKLHCIQPAVNLQGNKNQQIKQFKEEVRKQCRLLKKMNIQQPSFLDKRHDILFYNDYELSVAAIELCFQHFDCFYLDAQETFNCFQVVLWMIKILDGNKRLLQLKNVSISGRINQMIELVQVKFNKLKERKKIFEAEDWYIITSNSLDCLLLVCHEKFDPILDILKTLRQKVGTSFQNSFVMSIYVYLICQILEKSEFQNLKICPVLLKQTEEIATQILENHTKKGSLQILQMTNLLHEVIKIYNKRSKMRESFDLIKWVIQQINNPQLYFLPINKASVLKLIINTFCYYYNVVVWVIGFRELAKIQFSSMPIEFLYFQFCLLSNIIKFTDQQKRANIIDPDTSLKSFISSTFSLRVQLDRLGRSVNQMLPSYSRQVISGLYECYRLSFPYKSIRKRDICLKRERNYANLKIIGIQKLKYFPSKMRKRVLKRLKNKSLNLNFWTQTEDLKLELTHKYHDT